MDCWSLSLLFGNGIWVAHCSFCGCQGSTADNTISLSSMSFSWTWVNTDVRILVSAIQSWEGEHIVALDAGIGHMPVPWSSDLGECQIECKKTCSCIIPSASSSRISTWKRVLTAGDLLVYPPSSSAFFAFLLQSFFFQPGGMQNGGIGKSWQFLRCATEIFPPSIDCHNWIVYTPLGRKRKLCSKRPRQHPFLASCSVLRHTGCSKLFRLSKEKRQWHT